jgi:superfamily II DNA or RNA helicase
MQELRPYQQKAIDDIRSAFAGGKQRVMLCLPTGAGKTKIASEIMKSIYRNGRRVWFVVPRLELITQTRNALISLGVPHGEISASKKSFADRVCIVSRDTVIRSLGHYPPPDLIFFDEAHVAVDQQRKIAAQFPKCFVVGMTATPERGDGMPLKLTDIGGKQIGLYDALIQSESIPGLQEQGVLSGLDYYTLKLNDFDAIHITGAEAGEELDSHLCYGDIADYYKRFGAGRQAIGFAPTINIAAKCVDILNKSGFAFKLIHGGMPINERDRLIGEMKTGVVNGLVNAALLTYGFDAPVVSYAFSVRLIKSRPLWVQMVGRVIRGAPGKDKAVFVDHTGTIYNFQENGRYGESGIYPNLFSDPNVRWDFEGAKITRCLFQSGCGCIRKSKRKTPHCLFDKHKMCGAVPYYCKPECIARVSDECPKDIAASRERTEKVFEMVDAELVNFSALISESKRSAYKEVAKLAREYAENRSLSIIRKLKIIADEYGYKPIWIYYQLNPNLGERFVDRPALNEIGSLYGYKSGWARHKEQEFIQKAGVL